MEIDLILNWGMPVLIILWFVVIIYFKMKEPADMFFGWIGSGIKSLLEGGKDKAKDSIIIGTEIVFD